MTAAAAAAGVGAVLLAGRGSTPGDSDDEPEPEGETSDDEPCHARLPDRGAAAGISYRAYSPPAGQTTPVLLMHGRGGSEDVMFDALADVAIPGVQIYPRAPTRFGRRMFAWTQARSSEVDWPAKQAEAIRRMRPFLEWVHGCHGPPVVAGHSQGAHMAFGLAAAYPDLVRAAVGSSGALTPSLWGPLKVPVVAVHGTEDKTVSIENARAMAAELGAELVEVEGHAHGLSGPLKAAMVAKLAEAL